MLDEMGWKKRLLVRSEILGLFVNTLTSMTSIFVTIGRNSRKIFKCNYLKNYRLFPNFSLCFRNLHQFLSILKTNESYSLSISEINYFE